MELSFEFSTVNVISYKRLPLWIYPLDTSNDLRRNADPPHIDGGEFDSSSPSKNVCAWLHCFLDGHG